MHDILALLSGSLVGIILGLIGGGGSVLAVPLLLYVVGVRDPHIAIGTSAVAVAANAAFNLLPHARAGHVRWRTAAIFAFAGTCGAIIGSTLGKTVDGHSLVAPFAVVMIVVAVLMQRPPRKRVEHTVSNGLTEFGRLSSVGFATGGLSGFFGIGGGVLIVPGLIFAANVQIVDAIGSSLVSVGSFASITAANYALSGFVDWPVAGEYLVGGVAGGWLGACCAHRLAARRDALKRLLGVVLIGVAAYMLYRSS